MTYSLFTILPTLVILFWLVLFYLDQKNNIAKRFIIFFLCIALLNYAIHWLYFNHSSISLIFDSVWVFTSLSVFPLYYYYIRLLTSDLKINYKWSWILIPGFTLSLFSAVIYLLMSPEEIETFTNEILYHNRPPSGDYSSLIRLQMLRVELFKVIFTTEVILTLFYGLRLIKQFNKKVLAFYSDVEHRELSTTKMTLVFLLLTAITSMISNLIGKDYFTDNPYLLVIPSLAHSIVLFGLSYVGYHQFFSIRELTADQQQSTEEQREVEEQKTNEGDTFLGSRYDELYNQMEYLLKEEQIFRDSDLHLDDLASLLGTNRTYVSRLINNKAQLNFCDYINSHRIEYAKQLLSSTTREQMTLDDIALESGFSSLSAFYRVFTKMEGTTPAKYGKNFPQGPKGRKK